jgi:hypothetical protein
MRTEEAGAPAGAEERFTDEAGSERRRPYRRRLPFGRGAVLVVGGRCHIVGLADLSVTGAYLRTGAPIAVGETHVLRLLLLPDRGEFELRSEVVRVTQDRPESADHSRGVAVRFVGLDEATAARLEAYVGRPRREPKTLSG